MGQLKDDLTRIENSFAQIKTKAVGLKDERDALTSQVSDLGLALDGYRQGLTPDAVAPEDLARIQNLANELEALNASL